jgi:hypothetical protein
MSTQHTPGPWEFLPPEDGNCGAITAKTGWICDFAEEPSDANAALMVAAPELLEALKDLRTAIKSRGVIPTVKALSKTDAAIAKATGSAP